MIRAEFDHFAIAAETLEEGVAHVEDALGLPMGPGGAHAVMGTHNRLLGLGPFYMEVIAIDPDAGHPGRARWFDLDSFTGPPRLGNWILRVDDLPEALAALKVDAGAPLPVTRGDLSWLMGVRADGCLPFDNSFPALIAWQGPHPVDRLDETGCRLRAFEVSYPDATALEEALAPLGVPVPARLSHGPRAFRAEIETPHGMRELLG